MENTLEEINSRILISIQGTEEWISDLDDKILEIIFMEQKREKIIK